MIKNTTYNLCFLCVALLFSCIVEAQTQEVLSLDDAKQMALSQNKLLEIQQEKVNELNFKKDEVAANSLPMLYLSGNYFHNFNNENLVISQGGLGTIADIPIPTENLTVYESKQDILIGGLFAYQPITQLLRVNNGVKTIEAQVEVERFKLKAAESKIENSIEKLYYAVRIQEKKLETAQTNIDWAEAKLYDQESALLAKKTQEVNVIGLKADLADKKHEYLLEQIALENYMVDLKTTLMLPDSINFKLGDQPIKTYQLNSKNYYLTQAKNNNELLGAKKQIEAANYGTKASKNAYLPDLGIVGGVTYQGIISELPDTNYFLGLNLTWNILGFVKDRAQLGESISKQNQAKAYAEHTISTINGNIEKGYRNAVQAQKLMEVANEAYTFRLEEYRIKKDGLESGLLTKKELLETKFSLDKAKQDAFSARLNFNIAILDLNTLIGL
ncbi:TolC family protein [uncultured Formosa sp.]|uniref:TolC family protein n=1 Tax=uncultured Formosa sp. TaxID=255435 RepID=UPI0026376411|nr:TolC family protein [uncultured Formosa sp.]